MKSQAAFDTIFETISDQLELEGVVGDTRASFSDSLAPLIVHFDFIDEETRSVFVYFYVRTTSWDLPGERTDANELISVLLATFLHVELGLSCSLIDIPHPAGDMPETEIYARYIVPEQPQNATYILNDEGVEQLKRILAVTQYFKLLLPHLFDWSPEERDGEMVTVPGYDWNKASRWAGYIANTIGEPWVEFDWPDTFEELLELSDSGKVEIDGNEGIQFVFRANPDWKHYRSINTGITVYEARAAASVLLERIQANPPWDCVEGIDSKLFLSERSRTAIAYDNLDFATKILSTLCLPDDKPNIVFVPLEQDFVAISRQHLVFMRRECGRRQFENEREKIRKRHEKESSLLFPLVNFHWNEQIGDAEFERLVLDLLKREPGVHRARLVSVANERDGGKDILCEWFTTPTTTDDVSDEAPPTVFRRVIVQCKAYSKSVGKSDVRDIRDTVDHHEATGYFLAVSSQITTTLTDHLDTLRRRGDIWVDWWTRSELEERLSRHQDIARKYPNVVQFD
jgi:hypothetical protein